MAREGRNVTAHRRAFLKASLAAGAMQVIGRPSGAEPAGQWSAGPPSPFPVQEIYAAAHKGEIWLAGGIIAADDISHLSVSDRVFIYNPAAAAWHEGPRLREPLHHPYLLSHRGSLYLIGGFGSGAEGVWSMRKRIDVLHGDRWEFFADLPLPMAETVAASLDNGIHVVTGRTPSGGRNANWQDHTDTNAHFVIDPAARTWTNLALSPYARNSASGALVDGTLYVIGGRTVAGGNVDVVEAFNPARANEASGWRSLQPMPEPRGGIAAAALATDIYVFGGEWFGSGRSGVFEDVLKYDTLSGSWTRLGPMPTPRHGLSAVALGDTIFVVGGATRAGAGSATAALELFRPG